MSTFWARMCLIPRPAWITGCLLSVLVVLPLVLGPMRLESEVREWPLLAKVGLVAVIPAFILIWSALVGFIYADAKRRRMRHVMWAWLALVPYFIGVILYFILRDPLPMPCHRCGTEVPTAFAFCPGCGAPIHPLCSHCGKSLQPEWANCPHCGTRLVSPGTSGTGTENSHR
jgi:RNA polymerase subunit RPABC4/transcription elongation factor Spt4